MLSVPVSRDTVDVIACVEGLIVASTSPGNCQAVEDGEDLVAVRRQADGLHYARAVRRLTGRDGRDQRVRAQADDGAPPPPPALAT